MAYTTETIVRAESPFKDSTNIDTTYVTRAIAQADSFLNAMIGNVYSLPLSETPSIVQELSTKVTIYNLLTDQNLNIEVASGVNITALLEQVNAILEGIKNRSVKLFGADGTELALVDQMLPVGYPDQTDTDSGDAPRFFSMSQNF